MKKTKKTETKPNTPKPPTDAEQLRRDETIAKLTLQVNEQKDRICELREQIRSLGGVIASV